MKNIPLLNIPNQELNFDVEELSLNFTIRLKQLDNIVVMDLYNGSGAIFLGMNCKPFYDFMDPYKYKIKNFHIFFMSDKSNIYYEDFSIGTFLYYAVV